MLTIAVPDWLGLVYNAITSIPPQAVWQTASLAILCAVIWVLWHPSIPAVKVPPPPEEFPVNETVAPKHLPCRDPATGKFLGSVLCESSSAVEARVQRARVAQSEWASSSFATRRQLLRIIAKCVLDHADDICRVSARDSGKTTTDAAFGEVLVTLEKLYWLCVRLAPSRTSSSNASLTSSRVCCRRRVRQL